MPIIAFAIGALPSLATVAIAFMWIGGLRERVTQLESKHDDQDAAIDKVGSEVKRVHSRINRSNELLHRIAGKMGIGTSDLARDGD